MFLSEHYLGATIAVLIAAFWITVLRAGSVKSQIERAKKEGRHRFVEIEGTRYHALRKTETVVRTLKGHGRAILLAVGRERDPDFVNGKVEMRHRWIKIRSITKKGLSKNERWVRGKGWLPDGTRDIDYLIVAKQDDA